MNFVKEFCKKIVNFMIWSLKKIKISVNNSGYKNVLQILLKDPEIHSEFDQKIIKSHSEFWQSVTEKYC